MPLLPLRDWAVNYITLRIDVEFVVEHGFSGPNQINGAAAKSTLWLVRKQMSQKPEA